MSEIIIPYSEKEFFKGNDVFFILNNKEITFSEFFSTKNLKPLFQKIKNTIVIKNSYLRKINDENLDYYIDKNKLKKIPEIKFLKNDNDISDDDSSPKIEKSVFNFL